VSNLETSTRSTATLTPLTRREFYRLTERCHSYALELAHYDQTRVHLQQCHQFNRWLHQLKQYDRLEPVLRTLRPARPIARWQLFILLGMVGLVIWLALQARAYRLLSSGFVTSYVFFLFFFYFIPERYYGTTIELIEGKVLRIVETLEGLLQNGDLGFTEAAYFQAKENLQAARTELRQQIDLAHRRWR
jgi:hypothetical protein